ncbi:hypothetical protein P5F21_13090 [Clostridium perfringens]|nr:hypothetical protein [Clostridium perfringens]MDK0891000.1 hypothetical protein [Clostridium perfringens]
MGKFLFQHIISFAKKRRSKHITISCLRI